MMTRKEMRQDLVLLLAVAPFLAIIKPYGLYEEFSFLIGWLYWAGFMGVGSLLIRLTLRLFKTFLQNTHWAIVSLVKALVITPFIFAIIILSLQFSQAPIPTNYWPSILGQIFVMSLAIAGLATYIINARHAADMAADMAANIAEAPTLPLAHTFIQNLPVKYRSAELYAVSAEDHYLRVHTSTGDPLILMRFKDALSELSEVQGTQTHRSWWVAMSGVADTHRENTRLSLVLKSGVVAPVSRTYMAAVKVLGI